MANVVSDDSNSEMRERIGRRLREIEFPSIGSFMSEEWRRGYAAGVSAANAAVLALLAPST